MLIRSMAAARTFKRRVEAQVCLCLCRTRLCAGMHVHTRDERSVLRHVCIHQYMRDDNEMRRRGGPGCPPGASRQTFNKHRQAWRGSYEHIHSSLSKYMQIIAPGEVADDFNFNTDKKVNNTSKGVHGRLVTGKACTCPLWHQRSNTYIHVNPRSRRPSLFSWIDPFIPQHTHARTAKKCSAC